MATALKIDDEKPEEQGQLETLTLEEILTENANLADFLADTILSGIGQKVIRDVEIDESSRKDWLDRHQIWLDMAMQVREAKNFPWPKAANVKYPLLTVSAIQSAARLYPLIVDGSNLVKGRVLGPDNEGQKRQRADRIAQHMTWQLLYRMPGWEEETDQLLLMLPITGCVFRKTYFDSLENANASEMVPANDFIINYWAKSLDKAPRYTHRLRFYPHEVKEKIAANMWREVPVQSDPEDGDDEDALCEFYEQHRNIDLDGDGYPEPYIVTTTKEGRVARIVPCFGPDDISVGAGGKVLKLTDEKVDPQAVTHIVKIDRRRYFTKYSFIPAPDGSFYDIGFGWLLEDLASPINTAINQMLDAGTLQNAGGGFLGSGINHKGGAVPVRIGEWRRIETINNAPLRDNIFRLEHPGPSPVLFQLLGMLIQASKEITSVQDVLTGEGQANQPATTTLALIEQGHKVLTGIAKRIHRSFGQELRVLFRLNRDYLDEEEYFQLNDEQDAQRIAREDYNDKDLDVIPVSDPNVVTDMQKLARSEAEWQSFNNDPLVNQVELRRRRMEALGVKDTTEMLKVPAPAPDPKMLIEGMKEARAKLESQAKVRASDATAALNAMTAAEAAYAMGSLLDAANLTAAAIALGGTIDDDLGAGAVPAVAGQPADEGVSEPVQGPQPGDGGGMGAGGPPDGGGAGIGGPAGPAGGDQL